MRIRRLAWCVFALVVTASGLARADFFNARNLLPGTRAAQLGGAFAALADDGSAVYYNPAGLWQVPSFSVTASADAYGLLLLERTTVLSATGDHQTIHFDRFGAVPTLFSLSYGPVPDLTLAVSFLQTDRFRISGLGSTNGLSLTDSFFGTSHTFTTLATKASFDLTTSLMGPSAGYRLGRGFAVGVSAFYQLTQVTSSLGTQLADDDGQQAARQFDPE